MNLPGPTFLYLHGFASSPQSSKARAFRAWGEARGVPIHALDLRVPTFEGLRFSSITARVRAAIDEGTAPVSSPLQTAGDHARAVLVGSSLGGLAACRVAEADPRVCAVLVMAPAFRLTERWRMRIGDAAWEAWRRDDALVVDDYATGVKRRLDFGFVEELERLDVGFPDVRVPVCVIHGTRDAVVDIELSRTWAAGKPHVRLIEVDDGHELAASTDRILAEADRFFATFLGKD